MQRQWNAWGRRVLHPVGVALLLMGYLLGGPLAQVSAAQDYYGDTGHYLFGQFRDYWNGNGGIDRFGYPITKVFNAKSENGQTYPTQYLQRAVFEEHPENAGTPFEVLGQRLAALQSADRIKTDPNFAKVAQPNDGRAFFPTRATPSAAVTPAMPPSALTGKRRAASSRASSSLATRSPSRSMR